MPTACRFLQTFFGATTLWIVPLDWISHSEKTESIYTGQGNWKTFQGQKAGN
jgi:hypothetical protein